MNNVLVSVLIPVYNVSIYIEEALNSILSQTYKNIEVIIVDDCSTDNTYLKCKEYQNKYSNVKLYRNKSNMKICNTLNYGLEQCTGDYVLRMDGDDIASVDRIEVLLNYLIDHKLDLVSSHTISIDESGNEMDRNIFPVSTVECLNSMNLISVCSHNWLCTRELYHSLNGYRDIPSVEDFDFLQRALINRAKVGNVPYWGMKIRVRGGNSLSSYGLEQRLSFNYVNYINLNAVEFEKIKFIEYLNQYRLFQYLHNFSDKMLIKYINLKTSRRFSAYVFLVFSCLTSPFQFQKILGRIKYRRLKIKFDNHDVRDFL